MKRSAMLRHLVLALLGTAIAVFAPACGRGGGPREPADDERSERPPSPQGRVIVAGLDASGSYQAFRQQSIERIGRELRERGRIGDEWCIRWIGSSSQGSDSDAISLKLTRSVRLPYRARSDNPLDPKLVIEKQEYERQRARELELAESERSAAAEKVRRLAHESTNLTDIYGFLWKASRILSDAQSRGKWILLASDMKDTAGRPCQFDLSGANVVISLFPTEDSANEVDERCHAWTGILLASGAASVRILDVEQQDEPLLPPAQSVQEGVVE